MGRRCCRRPYCVPGSLFNAGIQSQIGLTPRVDQEIWDLIITQDNLMRGHKDSRLELEAQQDFMEEAAFSFGSVVLPTKSPEMVLRCRPLHMSGDGSTLFLTAVS